MDKQQFLNKWCTVYVDRKKLQSDLDAVIAHEIAKMKEVKHEDVQLQPSDKVQISKHTLVEVNRAFRALKQDRNSYIHKVFSDDGVFDAMNEIRKVYEAHYGPKKEEQPKLDPIEAWKQYKEENKPQPALNPIEQAYHNYKPIRWILWNEGWNIKKHSDTESIDRNGKIYDNKSIVFNFDTNPEEWELYTEPAEQQSSQAKLDNSFDKDRFEAMFRAVVASGEFENITEAIEQTEYNLNKLDAYYATKEGGSNG